MKSRKKMKNDSLEGLDWNSREDIDLQYIPEPPLCRFSRTAGCFGSNPNKEGKVFIETYIVGNEINSNKETEESEVIKKD